MSSISSGLGSYGKKVSCLVSPEILPVDSLPVRSGEYSRPVLSIFTPVFSFVSLLLSLSLGLLSNHLRCVSLWWDSIEATYKLGDYEGFCLGTRRFEVRHLH